MTYPSYRPTDRRYVHGDWPVTRHRFMSNRMQEMLFATAKTGEELRLTYANQTTEQISKFLCHYDSVEGTQRDFELPKEVGAGWTGGDKLISLNRTWRYKDTPRVTSNRGLLSTLEVTLVTSTEPSSLPPISGLNPPLSPEPDPEPNCPEQVPPDSADFGPDPEDPTKRFVWKIYWTVSQIQHRKVGCNNGNVTEEIRSESAEEVNQITAEGFRWFINREKIISGGCSREPQGFDLLEPKPEILQLQYLSGGTWIDWIAPIRDANIGYLNQTYEAGPYVDTWVNIKKVTKDDVTQPLPDLEPLPGCEEPGRIGPEPRATNNSSEFPAFRPSSRTYSLGDYNTKRFGSVSGQDQTMGLSIQAVLNDKELQLTFANRSDSIAQAILKHFHAHRGQHEGFKLPDEIFGDWNQKLGQGKWRYASSPQVVTSHVGTSTTSVRLLGPPEECSDLPGKPPPLPPIGGPCSRHPEFPILDLPKGSKIVYVEANYRNLIDITQRISCKGCLNGNVPPAGTEYPDCKRKLSNSTGKHTFYYKFENYEEGIDPGAIFVELGCSSILNICLFDRELLFDPSNNYLKVIATAKYEGETIESKFIDGMDDNKAYCGETSLETYYHELETLYYGITYAGSFEKRLVYEDRDDDVDYNNCPTPFPDV